jgi:hypothetical protein
VLSGLVKRIVKEATLLSVQSPEDVDAALGAVPQRS